MKIVRRCVLGLLGGLLLSLPAAGQGAAKKGIRSITQVGSRRAWDRRIEQGETLRIQVKGHGLDFATGVESSDRQIRAKIVDKKIGLFQRERIAELTLEVRAGKKARLGGHDLSVSVGPNIYYGLGGRETIDFRVTESARARGKPFDYFQAKAEGHAWANAYLLQLLSHFVFEDNLQPPARGWNDFKKKYTALARSYGLTGADYVNVRIPPNVDTQAAVLWNADAVILVFRGSEGYDRQKKINGSKLLADWGLTDFLATYRTVSKWGRGVKVHAGFANALHKGAPGQDSAYNQLKTKIVPRLKGRTLWVTGHSLGAALATLAAMDLQTDRVPVQGVYAFGSPRVGNARFKAAFDRAFKGRPLQRWVNDRDIVPLNPPAPPLDYQHVGQTNNITETGQVRLDDREYRRTKNGLPIIGDLAHHDTATYLQRMYANLPRATQVGMPRPPRYPKS